MPKKLTAESLKRFVRTKAARYVGKNGVTSVGIGFKETNGKATKDISIQFTVEEKSGLEALGNAGIESLPKSFKINGVEVPTDVIQRSYDLTAKSITLESQTERKTKIDPIVPGVSIGHPSISAGTLGCKVYDVKNGAPYMLSNWHVLNGERGKIGDDVVQPGAFDDNRVSKNVVGKLIRSHLGIAGDCAIASVKSRGFDGDILSLGVSVNKIGDPELGDMVIKSGRTTDVTFGVVKRIHVTTVINYGSQGDVNIGCFEIGPDPKHPAKDGEVSMGGDSGSAWVVASKNKPTSMMLGLHFAGETGNAPEHALACYASSVFKKLEIQPVKPTIQIETVDSLGFHTEFLGSNAAVNFPEPANNTINNDLVTLDGEKIIHYTHFSLAMSKSHRFARWVAWNIDGSGIKSLSRKNIPFVLDERVPAKYQVGNELYANNNLDRGHIARRADLLWGSQEEAKRANVDSFYYTNMTPQHKAFNQSAAGGLWGRMENAIFEEVRVQDQKVSVIGGPVFQENDTPYRNIEIPTDFWKIIAFKDEDTGRATAKAYLLTQKDLMDDLEAILLPEFAVYEVSISKIEELTDLRFVSLSGPEFAGSSTESIASSARRIMSEREIIG